MISGKRLTARDLADKTFKRATLRGLDEGEVTEFLRRVTHDFGLLETDNRKLREQVKGLERQVAEFVELEKTLKRTLLEAQKTSGEMKQNAQKESDLILKSAEMDAEQIVSEARNEVRGLTAEARELKQMKRRLRTELRGVLEGFVQLLDEDESRDQAARTNRRGKRAA